MDLVPQLQIHGQISLSNSSQHLRTSNSECHLESLQTTVEVENSRET